MKDANKAHAEGDSGRPLAAKRDRIKIRHPKDIIPLCDAITHAEQECIMVFCLDGNNRVSSYHMVTIGLVNQSQCHPREVFKHAVRNNAVSIMLVHNHPSGNVEPSESDLVATRRLCEAGKLLGIPMLDHIIVGGDRFVSIRASEPWCFG
jgi:DNA repair protein RadC